MVKRNNKVEDLSFQDGESLEEDISSHALKRLGDAEFIDPIDPLDTNLVREELMPLIDARIEKEMEETQDYILSITSILEEVRAYSLEYEKLYPMESRNPLMAYNKLEKTRLLFRQWRESINKVLPEV